MAQKRSKAPEIVAEHKITRALKRTGKRQHPHIADEVRHLLDRIDRSGELFFKKLRSLVKAHNITQRKGRKPVKKRVTMR